MTQSKTNMQFVLFITIVATIGGFLFGFDSGVINGTVAGLQQAFNSDSAGTGFNVASMLLGCAVGAFFAGKLADEFGRKRILQISAVLFVISAFGSGIADSSTAFVLYRIIGGIAVGAASVITPAYISEIAPEQYRGRLSSIQQVAIIIGLFAAFISNYWVANVAGHSTAVLWLEMEAWRWMFWVELIPAVAFLGLLVFIPESPRFLVATGQKQRANQVLNHLYGSETAADRFNQISASLNNTPKTSVFSFQGLFSGRKLKPVVWIGLGLATFQQLVGINVVFYYGAVLWQAVGFNEADALMINIISGGVSITACLFTLVLIDKWGRKLFLIIGSIGMALSLGLLVILFFNAELKIDGTLILGDNGPFALIAANAYVFFFNLSWGPVMWVMLGEMFPNNMRGTALSVSGLAQWGSNFVITISFPVMLSNIGLAGAYGIYFVFASLSVVFVAKFVRETKGKTLEAMTE